MRLVPGVGGVTLGPVVGGGNARARRRRGGWDLVSVGRGSPRLDPVTRPGLWWSVPRRAPSTGCPSRRRRRVASPPGKEGAASRGRGRRGRPGTPSSPMAQGPTAGGHDVGTGGSDACGPGRRSRRLPGRATRTCDPARATRLCGPGRDGADPEEPATLRRRRAPGGALPARRDADRRRGGRPRPRSRSVGASNDPRLRCRGGSRPHRDVTTERRIRAFGGSTTEAPPDAHRIRPQVIHRA